MTALDWYVRPRANREPARHFFAAGELEAVREWYGRAAMPATPLRRLPGLAAELGVGELLVKDETTRAGLPAFKIAGAQYAIARLVEQHGNRLTDITCATAGNHGLAVAHAGAARGLNVHVYLPIGAMPSRVDAIRACGAHVVVTSADYDATVRLMADDAAEHGWTIVSDTGWPGYETIPRSIMAGYTWILEEAAGQWPVVPDVVVVQAGVGSLAGAVAGWLQARFGNDRPRLVITEPRGSACVLASLKAGHPVALASCEPTRMVGLRCAEISPVAWPALEAVADAAMTVPDAASDEAAGRLQHPDAGEAIMAVGPSGACGLAAILAILRDRQLRPLRDSLEIGPDTCLFAIATEGAAGAAPHS